MTRSDRVAILVALSKELECCGSVYLAAVLVEEAFGRACMEEIAFGRGSLDTAVHKVSERLRRQFIPLPPAKPAAVDAPRRGRGKRIARVGEILERVELTARGEDLPDARRKREHA